MQKGAKALILDKLADDLSGDVDEHAITTTYDLFLRDAREKKWGSSQPIKGASNTADCLKRTGYHPDYGFRSPRPKSPWLFGAQVH